MKKFILVLVSLVSLTFAQNNQMQMPSQEDMQKMMMQMQEMQMCMAKLDKDKMLVIQKEGLAFHEKVKKMCSTNQRAKAQATAKKYAKKMANDPYIKQIKKCTKGFEKNMPTEPEDIDFDKVHVCDTGLDSPDM